MRSQCPALTWPRIPDFAAHGDRSGARRVAIGAYVICLTPYVVVNHYERYAVPLLAAKALLVTWGMERLAPVWYKKQISRWHAAAGIAEPEPESVTA